MEKSKALQRLEYLYRMALKAARYDEEDSFGLIPDEVDRAYSIVRKKINAILDDDGKANDSPNHSLDGHSGGEEEK